MCAGNAIVDVSMRCLGLECPMAETVNDRHHSNLSWRVPHRSIACIPVSPLSLIAADIGALLLRSTKILRRTKAERRF